jgi:hypothetical protein
MKITTECGHCGREVKVDLSQIPMEDDSRFWVRIWMILVPAMLAFLAICCGSYGYCSYLERKEMEAVMKDPSVKIEILEAQGSHLMRKITR